MKKIVIILLRVVAVAVGTFYTLTTIPLILDHGAPFETPSQALGYWLGIAGYAGFGLILVSFGLLFGVSTERS